MKRLALAFGLAFAFSAASASAQDITIAHVYGKTGALEAYAKQSHTGLMMGLEYATDGTMEIDGRKLVVIEKDTQLKPDVGKAMLAEAYGDDNADIAVGPVSSGVALAMLPVAEEYEKILIVEPAVADSITGARLEPLHLPHRPQLLAGRHRQRRGARRQGREDRHAGAGLRLRPRRRRRLQGGARLAPAPSSSTRNTCRRTRRTSPPSASASSTR